MHNHKKYKIYLLITIATLIFISNCQDNPQSIHESLYGVSLKGKWRITNNKKDIFALYNYTAQNETIKNQTTNQTILKNISYFNNAGGNIQVLITETDPISKKPYIYIQMLNSQYINQKVIQFSFGLQKGYNKSINQWKTPKFLTYVYLYNNFQQIVKFDIKINFQMKKTQDNKIQITLISDSLSIDLFVTPAQYNIGYFIGIAVINVIQIVALIYFGNDRNILANTSQWLLLQACFFILVESIFFFRLALAYYDTKLWLLFANFVLNLFVMMLILWKFTAVVEKFINSRYAILATTFAFIYFYLVYNYYTTGIFWVLQSMIFLWQIGYSINRGGTGGVSKSLVLVIILSRIPLLVIIGRNDNILKLRPDPLAWKFIIVSLIIHLMIIILQKQKGGRFFTPVSFIPDYYNYVRQIPFSSQIASKQCSICLNTLREKPNTKNLSPNELEKQLQVRGQEIVRYVQTKCAYPHSFHSVCLTDWLNTHLVCPICRTTLPPMNQGNL